MSTIRPVAAAIVAAALAAAAPLAAQPFGPRGAGPGPGMGPAAFDPAVAADARLSAMHAQLAITAEQQPAWDAFAAAVRQQAQDMHAARQAMWQSTANAAERMTQRAQIMQRRAAGSAVVAQAFTTLYAQLGADQRARADAFGGLGPRGPGFGMRGPGMGPFPG